MGWKCFKFWFTVRFTLACLAHFNWITAFYVNCVYFTLWKSYDLLWFWSHLLLCICFPPLRPENMLLVWINLVRHKYRSPQKSFRQLYNQLYNRRFTKSERELKKLDSEEQQDVDDDDDEPGPSGESAPPGAGGLETIKESEDDPVYPKLPDEADAMLEEGTQKPEPFKVKEKEKDEDTRSLASRVIDKAMPSILKKKFNLGDPTPSEPEDGNGGNRVSWQDRIQLQKLIPNKFQRSESQNDEEEAEKRRAKEQKKAEKERVKRIRRERREILRKRAAIERRRRNIADSIELMLQCLRSFASFALLVGNIRKHFLPPQYVSEAESAFNNPDLLMLFTITLSLDVLLFWFTLAMTYMRQCRLCCRLGCCKFWIWLALLMALLFGCMYSPMHYAQQQLDYTWCVFMPGSDLAEYFDG